MQNLTDNQLMIEMVEAQVSRLVINNYVEMPLNELNLNEMTMTEYLEKEQLQVSLNRRNPLIFLNYIKYVDLYQGAMSYHENQKIKNFHYDNVLELFRYIENSNHQETFLKEVYQFSYYKLESIKDLQDCFVLKGINVPVDDELPLSTFLENYQLLIDKAKALQESL